MQNCSESIENYCFKHKNLVSFRGDFALLIPHRGAVPLGPRWGLRPQAPVIDSRSPARRMCIIKKSLE